MINMRRPKKTQASAHVKNQAGMFVPFFGLKLSKILCWGGGLSDFCISFWTCCTNVPPFFFFFGGGGGGREVGFLDLLYKSSTILLFFWRGGGGEVGGLMKSEPFFGLIKFLYLNNPSFGKTHKSILSYITF